MKNYLLLAVALVALAACHARADKTVHTVHATPPAAAARTEPEPDEAASVEAPAQGLYRDAYAQSQHEVTPDNAWHQLREIERAIDEEREATTP